MRLINLEKQLSGSGSVSDLLPCPADTEPALHKSEGDGHGILAGISSSVAEMAKAWPEYEISIPLMESAIENLTAHTVRFQVFFERMNASVIDAAGQDEKAHEGNSGTIRKPGFRRITEIRWRISPRR